MSENNQGMIIRSKQIEKFDNPETDTYYCRAFEFKKHRIKYISIKLRKVKYRDQFMKIFCLKRMKLVPAHIRDGKYYNYYVYCAKHNMKINLGY